MNLIEVFEKSRRLYPHRVAVKGDGFCFTYETFGSRVNRFAGELLASGVLPNHTVGLCLERSAELLVGIFGILRCGAAYLPVDPKNPPQRNASILREAGVKWVVTSPDFSEQIDRLGFTPVVPDLRPDKAGSNRSFPAIRDEDTAYILFTSGSTGQPKGVMIGHQAVVNLLQGMQTLYPLTAGDVVLLKSPYTFDGSVWELFGWMMMGGSLYVAAPGEEKDPKRLAHIIREEEVAFCFFVPSMLNAFVDYYGLHLIPNQPSSLKWVSVGGEVLPPSLVNRFYATFPFEKTRLINVYGPTETTVYATTHLCFPDPGEKKVPLGRPLPNVSIHLLDGHGMPVPVGTEGEIFIGGEGVGKGYLNRPELTRERFLPNPFTNHGSLYRTGDIGRIDEEGLLAFIGREDFQVKLRGLRIEMGEIEHALDRVEGIDSCVVAMHRDPYGDDCLVAYLLPFNARDLSADYLLADEGFYLPVVAQLSQWLPSYMIPSHFILCKTFPLTAHEKIDRNALPPLETFIRDEVRHRVEYDTPLERKIFNLWRKVLGRESIGKEEDFFALGGHSIKAIQLITAVIKAFHVDIPLKEFYDGITVAKMVEGIEKKSYPLLIHATGPAPTGTTGSLLPLVPTQREMWILHQFDATGLIHNIQVEFTLLGAPDILKCKRALNQLVAEEEMLHSVFEVVAEEPHQKMVDATEIVVEETDLSACDELERALRYEEVCRTHGNRLFHLDTYPMYAFHWVRWSPEEYRLLLVIHHLIFDGWSLFLFMKRLETLYRGLPLIPPKWRNVDFAMLHQTPEWKERLADDFTYWSRQLENLPARWHLPNKKNPRWEEAMQCGERWWWEIGESTSASIDRFAQAHHLTPFALFLAAYQCSLDAGSHHRDVIVGTPFANRGSEINEELIGYFTNVVAIRTRWEEEDTLLQLVQRGHTAALEAFSHAHGAWSEASRSATQPGDMGKNTLFQAIIVMQNWPNEPVQFPGFTLTQREIGNRSAKAEFLLNIERCAGRYHCWLEYDTALYDLPVVQALADSITRVLEMLVASPQTQTSTLTTFLQPLFPVKAAPTCYIVGAGNLVVQCIQLLQENGFQIQAVFSNDAGLTTSFKGVLHPPEALRNNDTLLEPVDYLFSINNGVILKERELALASRMAINYHDAPLPAYAGMYATNWALIKGEKQHGITWHIMTEGVDAGDILVQVNVEVNPTDTALTLNTKCFEAAIQGFQTLLHQVMTDEVVPVMQDSTRRSLFPLAKRPDLFGSIYPEMPIEEIDPLLRGTLFGPHLNNEFALPWVFIDDELNIIEAAEALPGYQGTVGSLGWEQGAPGFYCLGGFIALHSLVSVSGETVNLHHLIESNAKVTPPNLEEAQSAADHFFQVARFEPFWRDAFEATSPLAYPLLRAGNGSSEFHLRLEESLFERWQVKLHPQDSSFSLQALFLLFLFRLSGRFDGWIGWTHEGIVKNPYFHPWVPVSIVLEEDYSAHEALQSVVTTLRKTAKAGSFVHSLRIRYPSLRATATLQPEIILVSRREDVARYPDAVCILAEGKEIVLKVPGEAITGCTAQLDRLFHLFANNLLENTTMPFYQVPLLSEVESQEIDRRLNPPVRQPERGADAVDLFVGLAMSHPERVAIWDRGEYHTYGELLQDVKAIAGLLKEAGVGENSHVGISMGRSYLNMVSILGILYRGGCFVPIDPGAPPERRDFLLEDASISLLLHDIPLFAPLSGDVMALLLESRAQLVRPTRDPPTPVDMATLAYIIYTSGSTGRPKGVCISRKNLQAFTVAAMGVYRIQPSDRVLQFSNLSFDACIEEIFCTLCSGASLYLRPDNLLQPDAFFPFSVEHGLTVWDLPTIYWRELNRSSSGAFSSPLPHLRLIILGGEAVSLNDIGQWKHPRYGSSQLMNTYGPTETTVVALTHPFDRDKEPGKRIPIGRPLPGYFVYLVDRFNSILPNGVEGELLIAGAGVATGYLNRTEEEQRAFLSITAPDGVVHRCYRTGDRVVADHEGVIHFLGRIDQQFKVRGFRIEPAEIELRLLTIDGVDSCHVTVVESDRQEKEIVAYYTTPHGTALPREELVHALRGGLPEHMVPRFFVCIPEIPRTRNGKVDSVKLQEFFTGVEEAESPSPEEANPTEQLLLELWKKILGVNAIGLDDDFFDLGGHSLKAVSLMAEVKSRTGINVPLASLIRNATIRKLAVLITTNNLQEHYKCLVPIRPEGAKTPLFLIHGAGLNVLLYQSLARHLGKDRPIYAFQASGADGRRKLKESIGEMADEYIEDMVKTHPGGPYLMLGFSLGGFIAYDMARKLTERGHRVAFTGLIDSVAYLAHYATSPLNRRFIHLWSILARPFYNLVLLLQMPANERARFLAIKKRNVQLRVLSLIQHCGFSKMEIQEPIVVGKGVSNQTFLRMNETLQKYHLEPAVTHIDLFKAEKPTFYIYDRKRYGWSLLAKKGLTIHTLPSEHSLMFAPPNDQFFAAILDQRLEEIENPALR